MIFRFDSDLNKNLSSQMMFRYANRWYAVRMDFLGTVTILVTAAVCIFNKGSVTPAEAGLALANIMQVIVRARLEALSENTIAHIVVKLVRCPNSVI